MAKFGLPDRLFRICSERDNLRAPHIPAGYPVRGNASLLSFHGLGTIRRILAAVTLGIGFLLTSLCLPSPQAHAADTKWWALGTFIEPLEDSAQADQLMRTIAPAWKAYLQGKADAKSDDHESAVINFARAIELYGPENALSAQGYIERANSLRSLGRNTEAVSSLSSLISLDPEKPEGYWARARIHRDTHDYAKALTDYETVARLSPDLVGAHLNRGLVLYKLRRSEQAIGAFEATITAANTRYERIADYWKPSHYAKSTPGVANTMLSLLRSDRDKTISKAHLWLGKTHFRRSRFWEASRAYEQAIKINPDYELAYKYRGWLNEKMGYIPEARADYKRAVDLNHGDPWTLKALRRVR